MKIWNLLLVFTLSITVNIYAQTETLHDFTATTILGDPFDFATLAGKRVLVVNTATFCAFTPQYDELQDLYAQYGANSFEIIGFPANDFANQEPDDDSTINDFCTGVYGVTFQMMSKIAVTGSQMPEIYKWLTQLSRNGVMDADVTWNFQKYMIDESGNLIDTVSPAVSPLTSKITNWLDQPVVVSIEHISRTLVDFDVYPNPSPGIINIEGQVPNPSNVEISLYNLNGELIDQIFSGSLVGNYQLAYNTSQLDKALYFVRIEGPDFTQVLKLVVTD